MLLRMWGNAFRQLSIGNRKTMHKSANKAGMQPFEIDYELRRLGVSRAELARALKVSPSALSNVIHARTTSFAIASCVARILGRELRDVWPGVYEFKPRGALCTPDAAIARIRRRPQKKVNRK
jgi:Ner family transcriptional regulator